LIAHQQQEGLTAKQLVLPVKLVDIIFGDIETLLPLNTKLLQELRVNVQEYKDGVGKHPNEARSLSIGKVFQTYAPYFKM